MTDPHSNPGFVTTEEHLELNDVPEEQKNNFTGKNHQPKNLVPDDGKVQLQRKMGLFGGAAMIVGTMIGSGIFISPKDVLGRNGSVGTSLIIWLACGLISIAGALCYIELGCVVPKSGGEYTYLLEGFGPLNRFFGPIPAFLYSYSRVLITGPSAFAVIALSFGAYATEPFYHGHVPSTGVISFSQTNDLSSAPPVKLETNAPPYWLPKMVAAGCVVLITGINCFSVQLATKTQSFFTVIKVLALGIIIVAGMVKLGQGHTEQLQTGFTTFVEQITAAAIASAFYSGLWSYDGWNQLNLSVEKLTNPYKTLPRAIWIALPLVMGLYILANISYLTVLTAAEILTEQAVAVEFSNRVLGVMAWIMPVSVACSTFGAANDSAFGNARVAFVAAREGHLMDFLSFVSVKWLTPLPAVLSQVPLIFPISMLAVAIGLVLLPLIQDSRLEYLYAGAFILSGLIFHIPLVYLRKTPTCMDGLTRHLQSMFGVAPSKMDSEAETVYSDRPKINL